MFAGSRVNPIVLTMEGSRPKTILLDLMTFLSYSLFSCLLCILFWSNNFYHAGGLLGCEWKVVFLKTLLEIKLCTFKLESCNLLFLKVMLKLNVRIAYKKRQFWHGFDNEKNF